MSADEKVTIELTKDEAATLRRVMARIGGCPSKSRRKHTDSIADKLDDAGAGHYQGDLIKGDVEFADEFVADRPKVKHPSADRKVSR
jgi:hypothetical protein